MRRLGQHFLKNTAVIPKIIKSLDVQRGDAVIEIGPGKEALTASLKEECDKKACSLILVERDLELAKKLIKKEYTVIPEDILSCLPKITSNLSSYRIVGNIPYYITGKLLRLISELKNPPQKIVLMVQEEVAERVVAKPPKMNLLGACVQFFSDTKLICRLKPSDFSPPPKVKSAVIELMPQKTGFNPGRYYHLVKAAFSQPRKTLANNLSDGLEIPKGEVFKKFEEFNIPKKSRAQDLNINQLKELTEKFLP